MKPSKKDIEILRRQGYTLPEISARHVVCVATLKRILRPDLARQQRDRENVRKRARHV